jgi:hypothetical protein
MASCLSRVLRVLYFPVPKNAGTSLRACIFEVDNGYPYRNLLINGHEVQLWELLARPGPFEPTVAPPGVAKIAVIRDPWRRLISAYRNRVLHYREAALGAMERHKVRADLPETPPFRIFVENLAEYRKIPQIAHHTNPQVHFLGADPLFYDHLFDVAALDRLARFFSERAGRPVALPRLRADGPVLSEADTAGDDLRRLVAERYEGDYRFLAEATRAGLVAAA